MAITQFRVHPTGFEEIRAKLLTRLIASGGIIIGFSMLVCYLNCGEEKDSPYKIFVSAILITGLFSFILARGIRIQKKLLRSYVLTVENGFIVREQAGTPPIAFSYEDIGSITRTFAGGFLVLCPATNEVILIPPQIERRDELERLLNTIRPVVPQKGPKLWMSARPYVAPFVIVLLFGMFTADPQWMVLISGLLLIPLIAYAFVSIQKSRMLPVGLKQLSWTLVVAIGVIIWWMWYRLWTL
jgi:hypothetical protein